MSDNIYKNPLDLAQSINPNDQEETRESALAKIGGWANEKSQYDADDWRSYLTNDESDYITNAVNKYGITKKELQALHPHFFHPGSYGSYGIDEDETLDQYKKRLGRQPTNDEYRTWLKPKIKRSYDEFVNSGYDRNHIRSELKDAYGYEDLINEAMGGSEDDDWFNEMKGNTPFPKGVFVPELDSWDKLREETKYLGDDQFAFLRAVARNHKK